MPHTAPALSLPSAGAPFEAVALERRDLRDDDVLIDVAFAGICHSDIHTGRDEWGAAHYPLTPGHEIAGTVAAVGSAVTRHKVGDRVGVGCLVDSCTECENCKNGQEMFCTKPSVGTYNSKGYDGEWTAGGYAQQVVVTERMVVSIPEGLELDVAAPLLCVGITTYSPLKRWAEEAWAAIGEEGLIADAIELGASRHNATSDAAAMKAARASFDLIINTVSADLDMAQYLRLLRANGVLANVGLPNEPYSVPPFALIGGNKVLTGSNIGGIAENSNWSNALGMRCKASHNQFASKQ